VQGVKRVYNAWAVVRPAEDLADQWVAHCLEFDIVTQGNSIEHAIDMLGEAMFMVLSEDLAAGKDPLLRRAPEECWVELWDIVKHGHQAELKRLNKLPRGQVKLLATQVELALSFLPMPAQRQPEKTLLNLPRIDPKHAKHKAPVAFAAGARSAAAAPC
jgi:predicted RNase H-like HicB family nuclease